jgi:hypothetical protein
MAMSRASCCSAGWPCSAIVWQPLTDRRDAEADPAAWAETARTTSFLAACEVACPQRPRFTVRPLLVPAIVYVVLILRHPSLFGAPLVVW